jgi:hypothetical protein
MAATGIFGAPVLSPELLNNAAALLAATPAELRLQARTTRGARVLTYGLLLDVNPVLRMKQLAIVARAEPALQEPLSASLPALQELQPEQKLPLLQLALPVLKTLSPPEESTFLGVLDELVHADQQVSMFEFALQRIIARALALNAEPAVDGGRIQSFAAVGPEIATVISALAHLKGGFAPTAFQRGLHELPLMSGTRELLPIERCNLAAVERALERLATTTDPIRARVIAAAGEVAGADGSMRIDEYELLRALAAGLDCPLPLATAA